MSTQRRLGRLTLPIRIGLRLGSWLAHCRDRVESWRSKFPVCSMRGFPAQTTGRTARREVLINYPGLDGHRFSATGSVQTTAHTAFSHRFTPPFGRATLPIRLIVPPANTLLTPSPADLTRFHQTSPLEPAALSRRTERYDGKGNLHLQHAA
jgi:hypothetical protein